MELFKPQWYEVLLPDGRGEEWLLSISFSFLYVSPSWRSFWPAQVWTPSCPQLVPSLHPPPRGGLIPPFCGLKPTEHRMEGKDWVWAWHLGELRSPPFFNTPPLSAAAESAAAHSRNPLLHFQGLCFQEFLDWEGGAAAWLWAGKAIGMSNHFVNWLSILILGAASSWVVWIQAANGLGSPSSPPPV